ncbi:hypothetical protein ANN_15938 [Periplaneta americana]|uniref:Uncharacterized protein n=1 Tax=Periplaneta americana TaxID=6978 RepID=A0ABQ8SI11_PERAM|nr:hypothetical protein ANN_15938 [Periplaneta americana]
MAGLCEGGNEPPGSLKASKAEVSKKRIVIRALDAARRTQCAVRLEKGERLVPQQMGAVSEGLRQRSAYVYK